jgi:hypothetical protein
MRKESLVKSIEPGINSKPSVIKKSELNKYLKNLKKDYKYFFLRYFNKNAFLPDYNFFDKTFLQHFDIVKFIDLFDKRMKRFLLDVEYKLDKDSSYNVYLGLVSYILIEVKEGILKELYNQVYCDLEAEYFDFILKRLSKKRYKSNIIFWVTQLNNELFDGIEVKDLENIPDSSDFEIVELKTHRIFLIDLILDNVLAKYEFLFAVGSQRFLDAKNILKISNRRNYLRPEDESYKTYITFCEDILNNQKTKYKAILTYCYSRNNSGLKTSQKSVEISFNTFLKNHKAEILAHFKITEKKYQKMFFPKKIPKS